MISSPSTEVRGGEGGRAGSSWSLTLAFRQPRPVLIRSLDVIHIGSALAGKAQALVATDTWLREVAALARLKVLPE